MLQLSSDAPRSRAPAPLQLFPGDKAGIPGPGASAHAQPGLCCTKESPGLSLEPLSIAVVPGPAGSINAFSWGMACGGGKLCWNCLPWGPCQHGDFPLACQGQPAKSWLRSSSSVSQLCLPGKRGSRVAGSETRTNAPALLNTFYLFLFLFSHSPHCLLCCPSGTSAHNSIALLCQKEQPGKFRAAKLRNVVQGAGCVGRGEMKRRA